MVATEPLNRRVVEQMLVGVAARQYARSLDPLPAVARGFVSCPSSGIILIRKASAGRAFAAPKTPAPEVSGQ